ncbi:MAG: hypothetical protein OEO82_03490 [Gammaproteobacteria bacterium]|nr:hypothetical protein [Gammaproteobacteria bacterium]
MAIRLTTITALAALLTGCLAIEGTYYPACVAYEGSKVQLRDGNFVWDKFTDQVHVDDNGNVVDQFPDYPKRGAYAIDGREVRMYFEADQAEETLYVRQHDHRLLLLTAAELAEWEKTGRYSDCALLRE